jgi:hypothetical protein
MNTENPNYVEEYDRLQAKRFGTSEKQIDTQNLEQVILSNS